MTDEFEAIIEEAPRGGALIEIPFDAREAFGSGRPKVVATFDGVQYRGSIASMGGRWVLGIRKDIREAIGKRPGDAVRVTVAKDEGPRTIDVPADLAAALREAGVRDAFDALSFTKRREAARSVTDAKRPETRDRRIRAIVADLGVHAREGPQSLDASHPP